MELLKALKTPVPLTKFCFGVIMLGSQCIREQPAVAVVLWLEPGLEMGVTDQMMMLQTDRETDTLQP